MEITRRNFLQISTATSLTYLLENSAHATPKSDTTDKTRMLQRIQEARDTYNRAPWIHQALQRVAQQSEYFTHAEQTHKVSRFYLAGICMKETMGVPYLISNKGALGIMQVMPGTAEAMGFPPHTIYATKNKSTLTQKSATKNNILCAAKYLAYSRNKIVETYPSKPRSEQGFMTLAAYAGGLGTLTRIMQYTPHFSNLPNTSALHQYVVRVNALTMLVEENRNLFGFNI